LKTRSGLNAIEGRLSHDFCSPIVIVLCDVVHDLEWGTTCGIMALGIWRNFRTR